MAQRRSSRSRHRGGARPSGRSSDGSPSSSRARGGGSGPPARGGGGSRRRPPARGGGGLGAGPIAAAGVILVLGVVALFFVLKDNKTPPPKNDATSGNQGRRAEPVKQLPSGTPAEDHGPPPLLSKSVQLRAKSVSQRMKEMLEDVTRLKNESVAAKDAGDDDLWQDKMKEAIGVRDGMLELWNEIIAEMPSKKPYWDQERVAQHWLAKASQPLAKAVEATAGFDKMRRK